jgi:hypothetical protein
MIKGGPCGIWWPRLGAWLRTKRLELEIEAMSSRGLVLRRVIWLSALAAVLASPKLAMAQAGVAVDAEGVLRLKSTADQSGQLSKQQQAAVRAALNTKAANKSPIRYISLKHLERAIREHDGTLTDEMRYLAGLLRVHYVFFYPDSGDIVIAGPAEGWTTDPVERVIGISSGRPVIRIEDLCVALRAFPPHGKATRLIGCSIDPTEEGLKAYEQFVRSIGSSLDPDDTQKVEMVAEGMRNAKGLQSIRVNGVSPKTHFAMVMVEADFRMKLIGIGLEKPPVKLVSFVDRPNAALGNQGLARWFFTPNYECVRTSTDGQAMELVGDGVKVVGEEELVAINGQRTAAGQPNRASQAFAKDFTKVYSELADRSPVYAELRNMIDLAVTAAYIQQHDFYGKANWKADVLGDEHAIATEVYNAPKQVATVVNVIRKGSRLAMPNGGVDINPMMALAPEKVMPDKDSKVAAARAKVKIELPKGRWWWD